VPSHRLEIETPRGVMPVHVTRPASSGAAPLIVMYMDSLGIREVLHDHARRLTDAGYATALPDLFFDVPLDGRPRIERLAAGDEEEFRRMGELVASLDDQAILEDTERVVTAVGAHGQWGCVGFCMGGRFGLRAAETFGDDVAAASLLHPSRLVTDEPDSPHLAVDRIEGALYLGLGQNDHVTPPDTLGPLRERLERNHVAHRIDVLPGADHGFTMPGMPSYNEAAAEQAWTGTLAVLGERLR
jgi:carboxymethylenebutenolidase